MNQPKARAPLAMIAWIASGLISAALAQSPTHSPSQAQSTAQPKASPDAPSVVDPDDADVAKATTPASPWRAEASTWIWIMGIDGEIGVRGLTIDVNASFVDIVEASDSIFAYSGRLEVGYGAIAGFIDGMYADLGVEDESGPLGLASVDISFRQTIVDFGLMYRLVDEEPKGDAGRNPRNLTLDLYAGARFVDLDIEFDPALVDKRSQGAEWFDPIVGLKLVYPVNEHWHYAINADIGGFGVESDLTWSVTALLGYDFHMFNLPASAMFGYRAMGWDFGEGSGANEFTWQVVQHGLLLGLSLQF